MEKDNKVYYMIIDFQSSKDTTKINKQKANHKLE